MPIDLRSSVVQTPISDWTVGQMVKSPAAAQIVATAAIPAECREAVSIGLMVADQTGEGNPGVVSEFASGQRVRPTSIHGSGLITATRQGSLGPHAGYLQGSWLLVRRARSRVRSEEIK